VCANICTLRKEPSIPSMTKISAPTFVDPELWKLTLLPCTSQEPFERSDAGSNQQHILSRGDKV
jgi:hypothetical protein